MHWRYTAWTCKCYGPPKGERVCKERLYVIFIMHRAEGNGILQIKSWHNNPWEWVLFCLCECSVRVISWPLPTTLRNIIVNAGDEVIAKFGVVLFCVTLVCVAKWCIVLMDLAWRITCCTGVLLHICIVYEGSVLWGTCGRIVQVWYWRVTWGIDESGRGARKYRCSWAQRLMAHLFYCFNALYSNTAAGIRYLIKANWFEFEIHGLFLYLPSWRV